VRERRERLVAVGRLLRVSVHDPHVGDRRAQIQALERAEVAVVVVGRDVQLVGSARSATFFAAEKPCHCTSTFTTSIAWSSKYGRYCRIVWSCSPEQIGARTDAFSWASACGSWLSISSQKRSYGSSARPTRI